MSMNGLYNNHGFSLLEAVVALFILLFFIMMTNAYTGVYLKTKGSVRSLSRATTLGNDAIEKIRNTAFTAIQDGSDTVDQTYIRTWVVDASKSDNNKKTIDLAVRWPMATKKHSINFSTIIAK